MGLGGSGKWWFDMDIECRDVGHGHRHMCW